MDFGRIADGKIIMDEFYWIVGIAAFWLLLQLVILPKLGIDT